MTHHSLTFASYARRVLQECAAEGSNRFRMCRVRQRRTFISSPRDTTNLWAQVPKISSVWNNTHVLTWATKHACARVHQTYIEEDDGESSVSLEDEEEPEDSEETSPNQDLFMPVSPNKTSASTITIVVCSGYAYF